MYNSFTISKEIKKDSEQLFIRQDNGYWKNQAFNPEKRQQVEMVQHLHMKNRKKYTHLYQLEKYFK